MTYKIWYSKDLKAGNFWAVKEKIDMRPQEWQVPAVRVTVPVKFVVGKPGETPQCWVEAQGYAAVDGTDNALVIR